MKAAFRLMALALLFSAISTLNSGCSWKDEKPQVAAVQAPGPPPYLKPIYAPKMKLGDDIRVHNNRRAGIIKRLNSIIKKAEAAWLAMQADLAKSQGAK